LADLYSLFSPAQKTIQIGIPYTHPDGTSVVSSSTHSTQGLLNDATFGPIATPSRGTRKERPNPLSDTKRLLSFRRTRCGISWWEELFGGGEVDERADESGTTGSVFGYG
jgi:hypothetical protein